MDRFSQNSVRRSWHQSQHDVIFYTVAPYMKLLADRCSGKAHYS